MPGPGLGMELHRARVQLRVVEALDGAVVERDVGRLAVVARRDGEAVVLARHEDAARRALEHRVVGAAVTERQLVGRVPGGEPEELVPEADAEDARAAEQAANRLDLGDERLRVTGAVRQQDAVEAGEVVGVGDVREHRHRRARRRSRRMIEVLAP